MENGSDLTIVVQKIRLHDNVLEIAHILKESDNVRKIAHILKEGS